MNGMAEDGCLKQFYGRNNTDNASLGVIQVPINNVQTEGLHDRALELPGVISWRHLLTTLGTSIANPTLVDAHAIPSDLQQSH